MGRDEPQWGVVDVFQVLDAEARRPGSPAARKPGGPDGRGDVDAVVLGGEGFGVSGDDPHRHRGCLGGTFGE
ncbi:hypothetical protein [Amycolatopsis sp. NPDC021455]|uniref:hypothetical protein n=1 Tax=Amycolatopsis sp. NPDC021455 TaxID=3154901 RepID=UPI003400AAA0